MPTHEFNDLSKADRDRLKQLQVLELAARGYAPPRPIENTLIQQPVTRNRFGLPLGLSGR